MEYIKLFDTHSQYESYAGGGGMLKPNVSHCVSENEVHYNSLIDKVLVAKYVPEIPEINELVEGPGEIVPTQLYFYDNSVGSLGVNMFDKVEIDGVEVSVSDLDASVGTYLFSTAVEHTVKYTLKDPTFIGAEVDEQTGMPTKFGAMFMNCSCVEYVEIPNSVTSIGERAFYGCGLTSVAIPNSVTSIGEAAFERCSSLSSINIPDSVTNIGDDAFCDTNLDEATQAKILAINEYGICDDGK